jgi:hypothetical protein
LFRALSTKVNILICSVNQAGHCSRQDDASSPVPRPTLHPKRTTPLKRNMIAWRRRFRCWALKSPARLCPRSPAKVHRAGKKKAPRVRHRTASRASAGSPLAPVPSRRSRGGPTRDDLRTTHVGPNQAAGPPAWSNRVYANFVAKTVLLDEGDLARELPAEINASSRAPGFRAPYRCLSPCDESLLWAGSISTIVHSGWEPRR